MRVKTEQNILTTYSTSSILIQSVCQCFYLRNLYLFLKLANQVIFILFLHPAQVNMTLNLLIVFLTLVDFTFLLGDLELELLCL